MDDGVDLVLCNQLGDQPGIANVAVDKCMPFGRWQVLEVLQRSRIRERIEIHHVYLRFGTLDKPNEVRADKTRAACDEDVLPHNMSASRDSRLRKNHTPR